MKIKTYYNGKQGLEASLREESAKIYEMLEEQLITLKFKAARCGRTCFENKKVLESVPCERQCMSSVRNAVDVMKAQQKLIDSKLQKCIGMISNAKEGLNANVLEALKGPSLCYEDYLKDLKHLQEEMRLEFSYYL